ncbi:MAG: LacI family transcriptional regulator [Bacteroidales bacterium]|nr:LacI family transcriptional regulator [Bacteroidales bacterium]MCF8455163.1 LacI family transcriptional regulator [Bacteroidales bacterium]
MSLSRIAKELGLSTATVSYVVNGKGDQNKIPKDTQERVTEYADKINYKPNKLARSLFTGKTNTIGLIISDIGNFYYSKMAKSIEEEARKNGYETMIVSSHEEPELESDIIQNLCGRKVDGLIISTTGKNKEDIKALRDSHFPLVLIDRRYKGLKTNLVQSEIFDGSFKVVNHLLKLNYQKIGVVTTLNHLPSMSDRVEAYKEALKGHHISFNSNLVKEVPFDAKLELIKTVLSDLITSPNAIDALYVTNNKLTMLCYEALTEMNVRIPFDCAFVSFDDMDYFKYITPSLTAVKQNVDEMGKIAVRILIEEINTNALTKRAKKVVKVKMDLNIRNSCGSLLKNAMAV